MLKAVNAHVWALILILASLGILITDRPSVAIFWASTGSWVYAGLRMKAEFYRFGTKNIKELAHLLRAEKEKFLAGLTPAQRTVNAVFGKAAWYLAVSWPVALVLVLMGK